MGICSLFLGGRSCAGWFQLYHCLFLWLLWLLLWYFLLPWWCPAVFLWWWKFCCCCLSRLCWILLHICLWFSWFFHLRSQLSFQWFVLLRGLQLTFGFLVQLRRPLLLLMVISKFWGWGGGVGGWLVYFITCVNSSVMISADSFVMWSPSFLIWAPCRLILSVLAPMSFNKDFIYDFSVALSLVMSDLWMMDRGELHHNVIGSCIVDFLCCFPVFILYSLSVLSVLEVICTCQEDDRCAL